MVAADIPRDAVGGMTSRGSLKALGQFVRREPVGAVAGVAMLLLVVAAIAAPLIAPYAPNEIPSNAVPLQGPSRSNLLGTDELGRDIFSRLIHGGRVSLAVGIFASVGAAIPATALGLLAAQWRGKVDAILIRVIDVVQALPAIVFLVAGLAIAGPGVRNIILVLALRAIFPLARLVRGSALTVSQQPFIESAVVVGSSRLRIILRHMLPNIAPLLLVFISISTGGLIIAEASLSFLGYGVKPPDTSWGMMMGGNSRIYMTAAPQILLGPSIALIITVLSLNILADTLRDYFDPRLKRR